jgi:phosphoribosylanthranilate isomerase
VKVKICGITNVPDAEAAASSGADAIGFVFYDASPRAISISAAAAISRRLPPTIIRTGVFVDASRDTVQAAVDECGLNLLQFHGDESPGYCASFDVMTMKAFRVRDRGILAKVEAYRTPAILLDAYSAGMQGGNGETFDWEIAREANGKGRLLFLAGGLTEANVAAAIRHVQPHAVDVSSGVENQPGQKDHGKVARFIAAAKGA